MWRWLRVLQPWRRRPAPSAPIPRDPAAACSAARRAFARWPHLLPADSSLETFAVWCIEQGAEPSVELYAEVCALAGWLPSSDTPDAPAAPPSASRPQSLASRRPNFAGGQNSAHEILAADDQRFSADKSISCSLATEPWPNFGQCGAKGWPAPEKPLAKPAAALAPPLAPHDAARRFVAWIIETGRSGQGHDSDALRELYILHTTLIGHAPISQNTLRKFLKRLPGVDKEVVEGDGVSRSARRDGRRTQWVLRAPLPAPEPVHVTSEAAA